MVRQQIKYLETRRDGTCYELLWESIANISLHLCGNLKSMNAILSYTINITAVSKRVYLSTAIL